MSETNDVRQQCQKPVTSPPCASGSPSGNISALGGQEAQLCKNECRSVLPPKREGRGGQLHRQSPAPSRHDTGAEQLHNEYCSASPNASRIQHKNSIQIRRNASPATNLSSNSFRTRRRCAGPVQRPGADAALQPGSVTRAPIPPPPTQHTRLLWRVSPVEVSMRPARPRAHFICTSSGTSVSQVSGAPGVCLDWPLAPMCPIASLTWTPAPRQFILRPAVAPVSVAVAHYGSTASPPISRPSS